MPARNICVYLWCAVFILFSIKNMETALQAKFMLLASVFSLQDWRVMKGLFSLAAADPLSAYRVMFVIL